MMIKFGMVLIACFFLASCKEGKWIGVIYQDGNNPLHVGTFKKFEECKVGVNDKTKNLDETFQGVCLQRCDYNYSISQDVCDKAIDL